MKRHEFKNPVPVRERMAEKWKKRFMVKATLIPYESFFHRFYEMERIESTVVYWDVESQAWRSFQLENLLDWSPVC